MDSDGFLSAHILKAPFNQELFSTLNVSLSVLYLIQYFERKMSLAKDILWLYEFKFIKNVAEVSKRICFTFKKTLKIERTAKKRFI